MPLFIVCHFLLCIKHKFSLEINDWFFLWRHSTFCSQTSWVLIMVSRTVNCPFMYFYSLSVIVFFLVWFLGESGSFFTADLKWSDATLVCCGTAVEKTLLSGLGWASAAEPAGAGAGAAWPDAGPWPPPNESEAQQRDSAADMTAPAGRGNGRGRARFQLPQRIGPGRAGALPCSPPLAFQHNPEAPRLPSPSLTPSLQRMKHCFGKWCLTSVEKKKSSAWSCRRLLALKVGRRGPGCVRGNPHAPACFPIACHMCTA